MSISEGSGTVVALGGRGRRGARRWARVWAVLGAVAVLQGCGGPRRATMAPDFQLHDLSDQTVRLADFRGQPVLVTFWAYG